MDPNKNDLEVSHLPMKDIQAVAERIKKLSGQDAMEASLCLLSSLLPYQLRLSTAADKPDASEEVKQLSADFTQYLTALRDALLGA